MTGMRDIYPSLKDGGVGGGHGGQGGQLEGGQGGGGKRQWQQLSGMQGIHRRFYIPPLRSPLAYSRNWH